MTPSNFLKEDLQNTGKWVKIGSWQTSWLAFFRELALKGNFRGRTLSVFIDQHLGFGIFWVFFYYPIRLFKEKKKDQGKSKGLDEIQI